MNKSYRTVWNEALGAWVAASEITKARGKTGRSAKVALAAATVCVAMGGVSDALAQQYGNGLVANNSDSTAIAPFGCVSPAVAGQFAIAIGCATLVNTGTSVMQDIGRGIEDIVGPGTATFAVGIGRNLATGTGASNIVIGNDASATALIGNVANGDQIAIGNGVHVIGMDSTAIGSNLRVLSGASVVMGNNGGGILDDQSGSSVVIGVASQINNKSPSAVVVGSSGEVSFASGATAVGVNARVVGVNDIVNANSGTALGSNASVSAAEGTAVGSGAVVTAIGGTAVGVGAAVSGVDSAALGRLARATGNDAIAIGRSAMASRVCTLGCDSGNGTRSP